MIEELETTARTIGNGNLRPWKPGQCGNPNHKGNNGRPKNSLSLKNLLRKKLNEICPADRGRRKWKDVFIEAAMARALKNPAYAKLVFEYVDGKPEVMLVGDPNRPVEVRHDTTDELLGRIARLTARIQAEADSGEPDPE